MQYFRRSALIILFFVLTSPFSVRANQAPYLATPLPASSVAEGEVWTYTVPADAFVDPDDDPLTYWSFRQPNHQLPYWSNFDQTTRTFTGTVPLDADRLPGGPWEGEVDASGSTIVTVTATDPYWAGAQCSFTLTVYDTPEPPLIQTDIGAGVENHEATQHKTWTFAIPEDLFIDPESGNMTYSAFDMPSGMEFDKATRTFTWVPDGAAGSRLEDAVANSPHTVGIEAKDPDGNTSIFYFEVTVQNVNDAPYLNQARFDEIDAMSDPGGALNVNQGESVSFTVPEDLFIDPEGDALTYWSFAPIDHPDWMSFDQATRTFTGTVPIDFSGSSELLTVTGTDPLWAGSQATFDMTVNEVGTPVSQASGVSVTSPAENTLTVSWTRGDGANCIVLMRAGGAVDADPIDGTPYAANAAFGYGDEVGDGNYVVYRGTGKTVTVTGLSAQTVYHVSVYEFNGTGGTEKYLTPGAAGASSVNEAPTDISLDNQSVSENRPAGTVVGTFSTTDPDTGDTHVYSLAAGAGDTDNGSFAIDGSQLRTGEIFDFETQSSYSVRIQTDDGNGGTYQKAFVIDVLEDTGYWSDDFSGDIMHQAWEYHDTAGIGARNIVSESLELSTTSSGGPEQLTGYVDAADFGDAIVSARVAGLASGEAHLFLRGQADNSGYAFGIASDGNLFVNRRDADTDTQLAASAAGGVDPTDCMLKFAAVGDKLFGKAWEYGTDEPCAWDVEAADATYSEGDAGIGVGINEAGTATATFDDVETTSDLTGFWQTSTECAGNAIAAGGNVTATAGGSQVTIQSLAGDDGVFSFVEVVGVPVNADRGLFSGSLINKHLEVQCSYSDGDFSALIRLDYSDVTVDIDELSLRLYYYDLDSESWILAVNGNTAGTANWLGDSAPPGTPALGDHGVDTANDFVWAVVDHFTDFGAGGSGANAWVLQDRLMGGGEYVMIQGDNAQDEDSVSMGIGAALIWVAGAAADVDTIFHEIDGPFGGQLMFPDASPPTGDFILEVGSYEHVGGGAYSFSAGDTATLTTNGTDDLYDLDEEGIFNPGTDNFTVRTGDYLALRITNDTGSAQTVLTGGQRSWLNANSTETYPLLIELTEFAARKTESGVELTWRTESELETAGYNILRSTTADGEYAAMNQSMILATGGPVQPADYVFEDISVEPGRVYYYKLEDIEYDGASTLYGPVSVSLESDGASIALEAGWNVIDGDAFDGMPIPQALASIAGLYGSVWGLDGVGWHMYDPERIEFGDLKSFEAGQRYWIDMKVPAALVLP